MSVKIKVKGSKTVKAFDVPEGSLFVDMDGDLYIRTDDGAVGFDLPNELTNYGNTEFDDFHYFSQCQVVQGKIKIKVKLEGEQV